MLNLLEQRSDGARGSAQPRFHSLPEQVQYGGDCKHGKREQYASEEEAGFN